MGFTTKLRTGQTPRARIGAAEELARLHDTYATTHLMTRIVEDPDAGVRSACVRTLASLEDEASVPLLITLLEDEDLRLAEAALNALSAITHREYAFSEGTTIKARKKTAEKWRAWLKARESSGGEPATS
jgi:HEAT repeat protein